MIGTVFTHVRRKLLAGLLLVLPLVVTVWVVQLLFGMVSRQATPRLREIVVRVGIAPPEGALGSFLFSFFSVLITALSIYLIGLVAGNLTGRRILGWLESWILRVPVIGNVYGPMRQLLDAFGADTTSHFSRVVLLEYPRRDLWTIGFVTTERRHRLGARGGEARPTVSVFLPTTPNPTSGWLVFVPEDDLVDVDMSVEEAIKLIVSGGIVGPSDLGRHAS